MRWPWSLCLVFMLSALVAGQAEAHTQRSGVLRITCSGDQYTAFWSPPRGMSAPLTPVFSENCVWRGQSLTCGEGAVEVTLTGAAQTEVQTWLIRECDGETQLERLWPNQTVLVEQSAGWLNWVRLGFTHVLGGWDHVLFVLLLVGWIRPRMTLIWAISGFTLGHSCVLFLAPLWQERVSTAWIEAVIAASLVLLIRELMGAPRDTLSRRYPVVISSFFGLVHGMGFAGALQEWGVTDTWQAIFGFNMGIELGQLVVLIPGVLLLKRLRSADWQWPAAWKGPVLYVGGALISMLISIRLLGW